MEITYLFCCIYGDNLTTVEAQIGSRGWGVLIRFVRYLFVTSLQFVTSILGNLEKAAFSVLLGMTLIETIETRETALTVDELSHLINMSPKTIYKAIKAGRLPAMRILGSIRLDPIETAAWLRSRCTRQK